jgi:hypothetical protein
MPSSRNYEWSRHLLRQTSKIRDMRMKKSTAVALFILICLGTGCRGTAERVTPNFDIRVSEDFQCRRAAQNPTITFARSGATSPDQSRMDEIARLLREIWQQDGGYFLVEGHADQQEASTGRGDRIAFERAESVAALLATRGIPGDRIFTGGRGASAPIVPHRLDMPSEPLNRRAVIVPTRWGATCDEEILIRQAAFLATNCQQHQQIDSLTSSRCRILLRAFPTKHTHIFR